MPEFTRETYFHCETDIRWETTVQGNSGVYTVRWGREHLNHSVQYDYSCSCWAYKKGKGKHCKHIEQVKHLRCGWGSFMDGGKPVVRDGQNFCPKCGKPAMPMVYAV